MLPQDDPERKLVSEGLLFLQTFKHRSFTEVSAHVSRKKAGKPAEEKREAPSKARNCIRSKERVYRGRGKRAQQSAECDSARN